MTDLEELERLANEVLGLGEWVRLNDMSVEVYQKSGSRTRYIGEGRDEAHAEYIAAACNSAPELIQRIRELEAEADILADRLACHNPNCDCGFDVKYWRKWARDKREWRERQCSKYANNAE